ncbi:hypothetical protein F4782DRAFT_180227 [Xylaria castorea]|nr:hypothetical protein F4782DRAFT_180227 [Xylaria castorea]
MEAHTESTTLANDEDVLSAASKKGSVGRYNCHSQAYAFWWSGKWPIFITLAFLIGAIVSAVLSELVQAKRNSQIFSDDLNPSCTDFGNSAAEWTFAVDLVYGDFTFTQAKIIDATWDTVIGQGGRLLHGWILYRCVIYPLLVVAMEISTVTYPFYTTLSFSKASFETLLQLLRALHLTRSYSVLLCTILLIYTLAYTLIFPLVWGTATGYLSLSHKLYAMPGGDIVPLNSEDLSLCWVLDPTRPELPMSTPHIEDGPKFSTIFSAQPSSSHTKSDVCLNEYDQGSEYSYKYDLRYDISGWIVKPWSPSVRNTIWSFLEGTKRTSSENFMNIQRYALTRQFLQIGLDVKNWALFGWETDLGKSVMKREEPVTFDWWEKAESSTEPQCKNVSRDGLYPILRAVTLEEPGELLPTQYEPISVNSRPYNESTLGTAYWSLFTLDQSVRPGPGIVPYNSTIRLHGRPITLDAPFLDVGFNCSSYPDSSPFNSLGNCVCYKGQPISLSVLNDDRAICVTAPGYVWGFSGYLARVGLILEAVWMASCFVAYPWLLYRGKLLHTEPAKSAKAMRLILDCSEAVRKDVGTDTERLREEQLVQRLKNIRIGYRTDVDDGGLRYRVESGLIAKGFSERYTDATFQIETKISQGAERFETVLNKYVPVIRRMESHPVHDTMNERLDRGIEGWKSYLLAGKRRPTENEVYEDVNWRF